SDGRKYFQIGLSAGFGQAEVKTLIWETFKNDSKTSLPTTEKEWKRGNYADAKAAMESGETIDARIVTHKVEPYMIRDNSVNTYTTVVFADQKEEAVFAAANHPILDEETGELIGKKKAPKVVLATDEAKEEAAVEVK